jgi:hypothetical protein
MKNISETVKIKDIKLFQQFLQAVGKISLACKFEIDKNGITVGSYNDARTIKSFINSNSVTCDKKIEFCLGEIQKLLKCLQTLRDINQKTNEIDMIYTGTFFKYDGDIDFKLHTVKEEVIEKYISPPSKVELKVENSCTISSNLIKRVISLESINSSENTKVYISKKKDKIFVDVDDKSASITDSVGIPVSTDFTGDWIGVFPVKMDYFRNFNILNSESIKVDIMDKKVIEVTNFIKGDKYSANSKIWVSLKKV